MKFPKFKRPLTTGMLACTAVLAATAARADYSSTILGYNPLAYYRLNESAPVPPPDTATNLGTLGSLGNGFYVGNAQHPAPGALAGSTDESAVFSGGSVSIPYTPVLNPAGPFTVECWAMKGAGSGYPLGVMSSMSTAINRQGWLLYDNDTTWQFRLGNTSGYIAQPGGGTATVGQWTHLVGVWDGTHAILYVNGQQVDSKTATGAYDPNPSYVMQIGTAANPAFTRNFSGNVDEVAVYTNSLTPAEILAHYQNGISPTPSQPYDQLVLSKHPAGYWRLDEPFYTPPDPSTLPIAANVGTLGSVANGTYEAGSHTGALPAPYTGLGAGNTAVGLDGFNGYVSLGDPDGLKITNKVTLTAWIKPLAADGIRNIIAKGYTSGSPCQELYFRINGGAYQFGSCQTGEGVSVSDLANADLNTWVYLVGTCDGTNWVLYRNGEMIGTAPATAGPALVAQNWSIGSRGDPTLGDGRFFPGTIDEVAIFDHALSQQQIRTAYYAANVPPVVLQQPQAPSGGILAGAPVSLTVQATGTPSLGYVWTKNGNPISGATTTILTFPNITTNDAGTYAVVITNAYGTTPSSNAVLAVTYPTGPASLLRAVGYPAYDPISKSASLTQVILEFSGPLAQSASNPNHYLISDGTPLTIVSAQFTNLNMAVILTTSAQRQGSVYNVTLSGITDGVGVPLAVNTAQFRAWAQTPYNGVRFEYYPGEEGTLVQDLLNNMLFPDRPSITSNLWVFDSRAIFPDDTHDRYGVRMTTFFTPQFSGTYRFYTRSDDSSRLLMNPNGPDPAGKVVIVEGTNCCAGWGTYKSAPIPLVAGQNYYLEMLYQEGGGGDYGRVAVELDSAPVPLNAALTIIDPASVSGPSIGYPYAPAEIGGTTSIVGPASKSVQANHPVTFTVTASNPLGLPIYYQWQRNGISIPGATGSTYTFLATSGDNNARYAAQVYRFGSGFTTPDAVLTVQPDTDTPSVAVVHGTVALNTFVVSFSQTMGTQNPANYTVAGFITMSAQVDATGTNVVVLLDRALNPGQTYNVAIQNAPDISGTTLTSATVPLKAFFFSHGLMQFDYFAGLSPTVNDIGQLINDPRYPNKPDWTGFISGFDSRSIFPDDSHAAYGGHITGFFAPQVSGNYIFYIRSDDSSQFSMNFDGPDPAAASILAQETGCCHGFSVNPTSAMPLTNGTLYYVSADYKEGGGGDYVQVAAKLESDPTAPDVLLPIAPALVGCLADPIGASVTITQQPPNTVGVYLGARLNTDLNSDNGGFMVQNYGTPPGPWNYNAAAGSWTNFGPANCGGPFGTGLRTPVLTIRSNDPVVLTFAHRYSFEFDASANYDGGQVRLSVNGGPFRTLPGALFSANGYNGLIGGTIIGAISGTPGFTNEAFTKESTGYATRAMVISVASLGTFIPGDQIQVEFLASWDECSEATEPNWEIDSVQVSGGNAVVSTVVSLAVGAESTYLGKPNPYMTYFWQRDTGSGFADIPGANSRAYSLYAGLNDSGSRFRCIVYGPGAVSTSTVATVTVTMALNHTAINATSFRLSWPLPAAPLTPSTFVLEQSSTLAAGSWTPVDPATYQVSQSDISVVVTVAPGSPKFYRLHRSN